MANGVKFDGCNFTYNPPEGVSEEQCGKLHVFRNGACTVSAHELTDEELAEIVRTRRVFHSVWNGSTAIMPIFIGSESTVREIVVDYGPVWKLKPEQTTKRIVTIELPDGYKNADEFAKDCGFQLVSSQK